MKRILVGYDGSDRAADALHLARAITTATRAELIVAHVYEPESVFDGGDVQMPGPGSEGRARREAVTRRVFEEAERILGEVGFARADEWGSPAHALDVLACDRKADLLVLGSTHRGKVGRVVPGSVASRLLNGAPCAVAVAPAGYAGNKPFASGVIGVGCDASRESLIAVDLAADLAGDLGCSLRLISVFPRFFPGHWTSAIQMPAEYMGLMRDDAEAILASAADRVSGVDTATVSLEGDPATALAEASAGLDLLAVGSRGYGPIRSVLVGDVAAGLMDLTACPLLVTPRSAERELHSPEIPPYVAMAT